MKTLGLFLFCTISLVAFSQYDSERFALIIAPESEEEFDYNGIHTIVEKMPVFTKECAQKHSNKEEHQCSISRIQEYISSIEYPQKAIDKNLQGKVYVSFIVEKDGHVKEVKLLKGAHKILDSASLVHIKKMPRFYKPGKQRGRNVKVKFNIPINFKLEEEDQRETARNLRIEIEQQLSINYLRLNP